MRFFILCFSQLFQERLLPRLGEGVILMWTTVLLCMIIERGTWHSPMPCLALIVGTAVSILLIAPLPLSYVLKLAVCAWFLITVVAMGMLQFRTSDLSLMISGQTDQVDYRFALIDGITGAYIGVHSIFLYALLPIPGKGERWKDFRTRWLGYLDHIASCLADKQLDKRLAMGLVLGIASLAYGNHEIGLMPDLTLANIVLLALPVAWQATFIGIKRLKAEKLAELAVPIQSPTKPEATLGRGIGRARHSKKHSQL